MKAEAQSIEREALQWATDWFRDRASILSAEGSRRYLVTSAVNSFLEAYETAKISIKTDEKIHVEDLLHNFEQEYFSPDLRCEVAAVLLERNEELPDSLREFVADYLRNPKIKRKVGRDFFDLQQRSARLERQLQGDPDFSQEAQKYGPLLDSIGINYDD